MPAKYKLTYFDFRGRAEVIRFLFEVAGVEYEDIRIDWKDWPSMKNEFLFAQLPILEVDGRALCQSHVIELYLACELGLAGETVWDHAQCNMVIQCLEDFLSAPVSARREPDPDKKKEIMKKFAEEGGAKFLVLFDEMLKENEGGSSGYFVGNQMTVADIAFYHYTENAWIGVDPQPDWSHWPALKAVRDNVTSHPKIQEWIDKRPDNVL